MNVEASRAGGKNKRKAIEEVECEGGDDFSTYVAHYYGLSEKTYSLWIKYTLQLKKSERRLGKRSLRTLVYLKDKFDRLMACVTYERTLDFVRFQIMKDNNLQKIYKVIGTPVGKKPEHKFTAWLFECTGRKLLLQTFLHMEMAEEGELKDTDGNVNAFMFESGKRSEPVAEPSRSTDGQKDDGPLIVKMDHEENLESIAVISEGDTSADPEGKYDGTLTDPSNIGTLGPKSITVRPEEVFTPEEEFYMDNYMKILRMCWCKRAKLGEKDPYVAGIENRLTVNVVGAQQEEFVIDMHILKDAFLSLYEYKDYTDIISKGLPLYRRGTRLFDLYTVAGTKGHWDDRYLYVTWFYDRLAVLHLQYAFNFIIAIFKEPEVEEVVVKKEEEVEAIVNKKKD